MASSTSFHRWRPHPWHGLGAGARAPRIVDAYIEITPFDPVKYEVDKETGYLRVDRPQRTSSQPPALYGFVPRTYCGERVRALMPESLRGDRDPLDICVFSERSIDRAEVIVPARVVGGLPMLDGGEADDKIVAVLEGDPMWASVADLTDLPPVLVERLRHYFLTYKMVQGSAPASDPPADVQVGRGYGRAHAMAVIEAAMADYEALVKG
ncbi:MAG: inorganic pyrophosphatase [Acidobacteria bacterium]|nr:MAG: inorganic pyrophosphatase [Acidobacteriota bacterium]REK03852.1 MAG: inorganic pyrophosphatase [Acidobacteriota bacterium]